MKIIIALMLLLNLSCAGERLSADDAGIKVIPSEKTDNEGSSPDTIGNGDMQGDDLDILIDEVQEDDLRDLKEQTGETFVFVEGDAKIRGKDSDQWTDINADTPLFESAQIKLEKDSYIEIDLDDNKKIALNEETMIEVHSAGAKTAIELVYGSVKAKIKKLEGEELEIKTPVAVAAVRGTDFGVTYEEDQMTELEVYDGAVAFKNIVDNDPDKMPETMTVRKNNWAKMSSTLKPELMGRITDMKRFKWQHLQTKKSLFMNMKKLKKISIAKKRLMKLERIVRDPGRSRKIQLSLDKINELEKKVKEDYRNDKKDLIDLSRKYKEVRMSKASVRRNFIRKVRDVRKEEKLKRIKDLKDRIKDRKKKIRDNKINR